MTYHELEIDHGEGRARLLTWQDCEPIIEQNKALQNEQQCGDFRHIASIPNVILLQWLHEEWRRGNTSLRLLSQDFDKLIARKLRDPDWKWLRTAA
jgi:hypothetical protein